ncbi:hypothetical protein NPIL_344221 [Nephila pilipes]|uniref:Uncharacterized protein n=1 Tax=Nephila pilipes TaxID=299642 RepID=A0A8X6TNG8_NEPPI|nr:hypothetical protein NPIL_344221 [Nephila pilipes]
MPLTQSDKWYLLLSGFISQREWNIPRLSLKRDNPEIVPKATPHYSNSALSRILLASNQNYPKYTNSNRKLRRWANKSVPIHRTPLKNPADDFRPKSPCMATAQSSFPAADGNKLRVFRILNKSEALKCQCQERFISFKWRCIAMRCAIVNLMALFFFFLRISFATYEATCESFHHCVSSSNLSLNLKFGSLNTYIITSKKEPVASGIEMMSSTPRMGRRSPLPAQRKLKMKRDYCTWDLVGEWTVFRFVYWPAKSQVPFLGFRHGVDG